MHEHEEWVRRILTHFGPGVPATDIERKTGIDARNIRRWRRDLKAGRKIGLPLRDNVRRAAQVFIESLDVGRSRNPAELLQDALSGLAEKWDQVSVDFAADLRRVIAIVPISSAARAEEALRRGERARTADETVRDAKVRSGRKPHAPRRKSESG